MNTRPSTLRSRFRRLATAGLAVVGMTAGSAVSGLGALQAGAVGAVAQYVMSPNPIAPTASLAGGTLVAVTLTARDGTGTPVPGATVYLSFSPTTGGGQASANTVALNSLPQSFITDTNGQVAISYLAPSTLPGGGQDIITAQDAAVSPIITSLDSYRFSLVSSYALAPSPIAPAGSLAANQTVPVTLTAKNLNGTAAAGATVYLTLVGTAGGGSASVGGVFLNTAKQPFVSNASGQIAISYTTPATLPASGIDEIKAVDAPRNPTVSGKDTYNFDSIAHYQFSPSPIAASGTLAGKTSTVVTLTGTDTGGAPVAGAVIYLSKTGGTGSGSASVSGHALTPTPQPFVTGSAGSLNISYKTPGTLPKGGTDTIVAQNLAASPTLSASDTYIYVSQYVLSPIAPIAAPATLNPSTTTAITLTAEDASFVATPNVKVYLSFAHAAGGGSATANGTALTSAWQAFTADASGRIALAYTTPAVMPTGGVDTITAGTQAVAKPKVMVTDSYHFSQVTKYVFHPSPIAAAAILLPSQSVGVTLTAKNASAAAVTGATVYLSFVPTVGGGSASANGVALTSSPQAFVTNNLGQISITYTTPSVLPPHGQVDTLTAQDLPAGWSILLRDSYTY